MKTNNVIKDKSFDFAVDIVRLYKHQRNAHKEYVLSKQFLRSGTSIGANVREAHNAESKADFIHKLAISQKECDETMYWLELLYETGFIEKSYFNDLHKKAEELLKIIRSIIKTTKSNMHKK